MSSSRTVTVTAGNLTVGGVISGSGYSLTKAGAGTLILTGSDTYTGPTTVMPPAPCKSGAAGSINGTSAVTDNGVLAFSRSDSVTFSIPIGGSGNVATLGPGTLVLSAADTYSGGRRSAAAPCNWATPPRWARPSAAWRSPAASSTCTATALARGTLRRRTINDLSGSSTYTLTVGNGNASGTFSGPSRTRPARIALTKTGTGTLVLGGSDTYSGGTTLSAGQLNLNNASDLGSGARTSPAVRSATAAAAPSRFPPTTRRTGAATSASPAATTSISAAAVTMSSSRTVTVASNNLTVGGAISGSGYSLTKAGTGTLILTGADTYTGPTTVSAGTLQIGTGGASGSINSTGTVTDNSVLAFSRSDSVTFSIPIGGSGNVATLGPGTLVLSAADTYSGGTTVGGGTLQLGNATAWARPAAAWRSPAASWTCTATAWARPLSGAGTIDNLSGSSTYTLTVGNGNASGTFSGAIQNTTGAIALTKTGTGTLVLGGSDTYSGGTTLSAGQLNLNNAAALGSGALTISGGTIGNSSGSAITLSTNNAQTWGGNFTFAGSNNLNLGSGAVTMSSSRTVTVASGNLTVGGAISGSGYSLTKAGTGTLTLAGSDIYTGPTTVSTGTLQIGAGGAAGSINGTSAITDNGVLAFSRSDSVTFSIPVGGSGNVAMLGPGTLVLSASDTYSGGTTVGGGTLQLGNAAALGSTSGGLTVSSGVLDLHGYSLGVGALSGAGTINNLSGASTYTLTVGNGNASGTFSGTIRTRPAPSP